MINEINLEAVGVGPATYEREDGLNLSAPNLDELFAKMRALAPTEADVKAAKAKASYDEAMKNFFNEDGC